MLALGKRNAMPKWVQNLFEAAFEVFAQLVFMKKKIINQIHKAFDLIVIEYIEGSKDMIYSSGLTIFPQRARRHPAEFGFQSLDSDLQRICGNVLEKKREIDKN